MVEKVTAEEADGDGAGKKPADPKKGTPKPIDPPLGGKGPGGQLVTGGGPGGGHGTPAGGVGIGPGGGGGGEDGTCRALINLTQVRLNTDYPGHAASRWKFQVTAGDQVEENEWTLFPRQIRPGGGGFIRRLEFPGKCKGEVDIDLEVAAQPEGSKQGLFSGSDVDEMDFHIIPRHGPAKLTRKYPCNGKRTEVLKARFQPARPTSSNSDNYFAELEFHFEITLTCEGG